MSANVERLQGLSSCPSWRRLIIAFTGGVKRKRLSSGTHIGDNRGNEGIG
jgi:hypothetical protein